MVTTDLTLPQNQLPTHKKEVSSVCPEFSEHAPQPHSYQEDWMNEAAGLYTLSQSLTK